MDARYYDYDNMPNSHYFNNLFKYSDQLDDIKTALHINKPDHFSKLNSTVAGALGEDHVADDTWIFSELLSRGLNILINVGMFDMKDGVRQSIEWTKGIKFAGQDDF